MFEFKKPFYILLINIRETVLSFGIVDVSNCPFKIIYTTKENVADSLPKALEKGLQKVISEGLVKNSTNKNIVKISKVEVVLNSPFYDVYIKDLVIEKEQPFVLTEDQFNKSIEKHAEMVNAEKQEKLILERDVTNVMINGYELRNPFGKSTKKIAVSFYASFVDEKFINEIKESINKNIHISKIEFKTYSLNKFNAIRNSFLNAHNYLSIDVGEKDTDVMVVEHGSIKCRSSIKIGSQDFIEFVANSCSVSAGTALSTMEMMTRGDLKENCKPEIEEKMTNKQKEWINAISTELSHNQGLNIPSKVFLGTNSTVSNIFLKTLNNPNLRQNLFSSEKDPSIMVFNNQHFKNNISYKENVDSDIFITINAISLDKES